MERRGDSADLQEKRPDRMENYRRVTLLCTEYKLYVEVLTERLKAKVEEKGALLETQAGFRKKRGNDG